MKTRNRWFRRALAVALVAWVGGLCAVFWPRHPEPGPLSLSASDLPRRALAGSLDGRRVRVLLRYPLNFEGDPLVGVYSPSQAGSVPATLEFHFNSPPAGRVFAVNGTVSGFRFDNLPRWNRAPGRLVMVSCEAARSLP